MTPEELKKQLDALAYRIQALETAPKEKPETKQDDFVNRIHNLKAEKAKIGLPIFTVAPTYTGFQGEIILVDNKSTIRRIYTYLNGTWRFTALT